MNGVRFAPDGVDVVAEMAALGVPVSPVETSPVRFHRRSRGKQLHVNLQCVRLVDATVTQEQLTLAEYGSSDRNTCPVCSDGHQEQKAFGALPVAFWGVCVNLARAARRVAAFDSMGERAVAGTLSKVDPDTFAQLENLAANLREPAIPYGLDRLDVEGEPASHCLARAFSGLEARARVARSRLRPVLVDENLDQAVELTATVEAFRQAVAMFRHRVMRLPYQTPEFATDAESGTVAWPLRWLEVADRELTGWVSGSEHEQQGFLDRFADCLVKAAGELSNWDEIPPVPMRTGSEFATPTAWARAEYEAALRQLVEAIRQTGTRLLSDALAQFPPACVNGPVTLVAAPRFAGNWPDLTRRILLASSIASHKNQWFLARLSPLETWLFMQDRWSYYGRGQDATELPVLCPVEDLEQTATVFFEMLDADPWNDHPEQLWPVAAAVAA